MDMQGGQQVLAFVQLEFESIHLNRVMTDHSREEKENPYMDMSGCVLVITNSVHIPI